VGSPVYRELAVPPVMNFIESLPTADGCRAVPFITWGGATSGIALWQLGQALHSKGYRLAGGAKVLGVHSMMWKTDQPIGQGHPDADDERLVRDLVDKLVERIEKKTPENVSLTGLDYQPESLSADFKKKLDQPWMIVPKTIDEAACTQCGTCESVCPVGAVVLDPDPVFEAHCFDCFICVRDCPENAIISSVTLEKIEAMIRGRVKTFDERPHTQIFF
jgi:ferredoxin